MTANKIYVSELSWSTRHILINSTYDFWSSFEPTVYRNWSWMSLECPCNGLVSTKYCLQTIYNKAIRDGRRRPPRHQGFIAISYGGSELRHRSILETITHRPKCRIQKLYIFPYILTPIPNLYDHSFPRYGQITFLTFRRPTTLTFDLKFWKYLSVTVYPYVICMPSFIMIGWEMAEILHFEILRKHGQTHKQTHKHTNRQTWALHLALPLWGRGNYLGVLVPKVEILVQLHHG